MAIKPVQPERPWRGSPLLRLAGSLSGSTQSVTRTLRGSYLFRIRFDSPVQTLLQAWRAKWETVLVCDGNGEQLVRLNDTVRIVVIGDASGAAEIVRWTGGPT